MSNDESVVQMINLAIVLFFWGRWYYLIVSLSEIYGSSRQKVWLSISPLVCMAGLLVVLKTMASFDVVSSFIYIFFYLNFGFAWLRIGLSCLPVLGISWRDDVLERKNNAALIIVISSMLGITACFAGANIGNGPGWWCVLFTGVIATFLWYFLSFIVFYFTGISDRITIDRDISSSIRIGGYLVASGLIFGRGAAGDWVSAEQTVRDFIITVPVVGLVVCVIAIEWFLNTPFQKTNLRCRFSYIRSITVMILYIASALFFIIKSPMQLKNIIYPEQNTHYER